MVIFYINSEVKSFESKGAEHRPGVYIYKPKICGCPAGNCAFAVAFGKKRKNLSDNGGSFFINDPAVFVLRIFLITIDGMGRCVFSGITFDLISGRYFPGKTKPGAAAVQELPVSGGIQPKGSVWFNGEWLLAVGGEEKRYAYGEITLRYKGRI